MNDVSMNAVFMNAVSMNAVFTKAGLVISSDFIIKESFPHNPGTLYIRIELSLNISSCPLAKHTRIAKKTTIHQPLFASATSGMGTVL